MQRDRMEIMTGGQGKPNSYLLELTTEETYEWADSWPCSTVSGKKIGVHVDANGLCDLYVDGEPDDGEIDGHELDAIVSDFLPEKVRHLWPTWE